MFNNEGVLTIENTGFMKNGISIIENEFIKSKIIKIDNKPMILDKDVAEIYGVETREINQAVKNNLEKFPIDFIMELDKSTLKDDIKNFDILESIKFSKVAPKVFTEQGLYMLATILKGEKAIKMTIEIIRTFANLREVQNLLKQADITKNQKEATRLLGESGKKLNELLTKDLELDGMNVETKVELNLGILKLSQITSVFSRKKKK